MHMHTGTDVSCNWWWKLGWQRQRNINWMDWLAFRCLLAQVQPCKCASNLHAQLLYLRKPVWTLFVSRGLKIPNFLVRKIIPYFMYLKQNIILKRFSWHNHETTAPQPILAPAHKTSFIFVPAPQNCHHLTHKKGAKAINTKAVPSNYLRMQQFHHGRNHLREGQSQESIYYM